MNNGMEFLMVGVTTVIVPYLVEVLKMYFKVEGKKAYAILAIVLGCIYVVYTQALSQERQDKIWALIGSMAYVSHLIYKYVIKKKTLDDLVSDGGRDEPDDRDYLYEEVFGNVETINKVTFPKDKLIIQDQSTETKTRMACTRFGMTHIHNAQQIIEHGSDEFQVKAKYFREQYLDENPKAEQEGATLQSVLNQFKKGGYIEGYAKCVTDEARKQAIDRGQRILTGSLRGDWAYVRDYKKYRERADGKNAGHIFCIVGYDTEGWTGLNSFGQNNGYFKIPYSCTDSLYSTYAIIDKDETGSLQEHKDKAHLDEAKKLGIWNGENPNKSISRGEAVLMIMRAKGKNVS